MLMTGLVALTSATVLADDITLITASGYTAEAYLDEGDNKPFGLIVLHGKGASPDKKRFSKLRSDLNDAGYDVIAPVMPWSEFDGSLEQAMQVIDAAVNRYKKEGKKVVIIGHSLGGTFALIYAARRNNPDVVAVAPVAVGHIVKRSKKLLLETREDVQRARQMLAVGEGDKRDAFTDVNQGSVAFVSTTAKIYIDFYDPDSFPDMPGLLPSIKIPVLWVSGESDHLNDLYATPELYQLLPANNKNRYVEVKGDHGLVLTHAGPKIAEMLDSL